MNHHTDPKEKIKKNAEKVYRKEKAQAEDFLSESKERAANYYHDAKEGVEHLTQNVKDTMSDLYEDGRKRVSDLHDNLGEYSDEFIEKVREKPLTSLLIAGGIGFLIASLLKK